MTGKFVPSTEATREQLDWGVLGWLSRPPETGAKQLVVIEVELMPDRGHNFHKHPDQEEVIYVVDGQIDGSGLDRIRIKIWDPDAGSAIVYDSQLGAPDGASPTTPLSGGSIVIHTGR